jgi:hypothetical protein
VASERRHEFGLVRVSVSFVKSLGLTVVSKPDARINGHVVIPELNAADYQANKSRFTPVKEKLASEASKAASEAVSVCSRPVHRDRFAVNGRWLK